LKDENDLLEAKRRLKANYKWVLGNFKLVQATSSAYPECDFESTWEFFKHIQVDAGKFGGHPPNQPDSDFEDEEEAPKEVKKSSKEAASKENTEDSQQEEDEGEDLGAAQFETAFIRAKRFDKQRGLRGSLNRSEFLDLMIRIVYARYWDDGMVTSEFKVAPHIDTFMATYFAHSY
jgi:hypothetical protein